MKNTFNNLISKQLFDKYHLFFVYLFLIVIMILIIYLNNFMDDSDLVKIQLLDYINKNYLNRFCSTTKKNLIYNSKEKYITLLQLKLLNMKK